MTELILDHLAEDTGTFFKPSHEVVSLSTEYQDVRIVETRSFGRCLFLDGKLQSSETDEFIYHETLVHPAMLCHSKPVSVFIAGGGEGATLREVLRYDSVKTAVMVDLDQKVVDLCQEYLPQWHQGAFDDPRTTLLHEDARVYLDREKQTFDVIILDLSEPVDDGPSYLLFTQEFYRLCKSCLNPGGVIVTQSGCTSLGTSAPFHSVTITMESVFERVLPFTAFVPSFGSQWGFTLASTGALPTEHHPDELRRRLEPLEDQLRFVTADHLPCLFSLPKYQRDAKERVGQVIRDGHPLIVD